MKIHQRVKAAAVMCVVYSIQKKKDLKLCYRSIDSIRAAIPLIVVSIDFLEYY
jgi:hypothetical protein